MSTLAIQPQQAMTPELISTLGAKLDAIRAAINEQPPTEPAA